MFTIRRYDEPTKYTFIDLEKKREQQKRKEAMPYFIASLVLLGFWIVGQLI